MEKKEWGSQLEIKGIQMEKQTIGMPSCFYYGRFLMCFNT